jgi:hypothetical protein
MGIVVVMVWRTYHTLELGGKVNSGCLRSLPSPSRGLPIFDVIGLLRKDLCELLHCLIKHPLVGVVVNQLNRVYRCESAHPARLVYAIRSHLLSIILGKIGLCLRCRVL